MRSTAGLKPRSSIRSASSRTRMLHAVEADEPRASRSSSRPGVATTAWAERGAWPARRCRLRHRPRRRAGRGPGPATSAHPSPAARARGSCSVRREKRPTCQSSSVVGIVVLMRIRTGSVMRIGLPSVGADLLPSSRSLGIGSEAERYTPARPAGEPHQRTRCRSRVAPGKSWTRFTGSKRRRLGRQATRQALALAQKGCAKA